MFESEAACLASCATAWECVSIHPQKGPPQGAKYCLPKAPTIFGSDAQTQTPASFGSVEDCEAECEASPEVPGACLSFWLIGILIALFCVAWSVCCCGLTAKFVASKQEGEGGWSTKLHEVHLDWPIFVSPATACQPSTVG